MTALKTPPEATIQQIQTLLTEGYGSGFTIFKELVQNADDVGAERLLLAGHEGFASADNALLRAPGIFVANSGPVSAANWEALQLAAGGGKGGDAQAVGRFGLGQKALYHLCDAYVVFARLDGAETSTSMILNPYEDIEAAEHARAWKTLSLHDEDIVSGWADQAEMAKGLVLYIPLRTAILRPSSDPRMCLTNAQWTPREAIKDIIDGVQLHAAIACLRHLDRIDIKCPGERDWCVELKPGFTRLAGPGSEEQTALQYAFGGQFTINGQDAAVLGAQRHVDHGEAMALRDRSDWPTAWTLTGLEKAKATPHGAAVVCRHPAHRGETARLRIWQGVYLPLGDPAKDRGAILGEVALNGSDDIDLVIHGDFFVSSNRSSILRSDGSKGQDAVKIAWNKALELEATLPCVLEAAASAVQALAADKDRYDIVRALGNLPWWHTNGRAICQGRALVRIHGVANGAWTIAQAASLRPIPPDVTPRRLGEAWKGMTEWCRDHGFMLAQGTTLGETQPRWSDRELAELIAGMAPAALYGKDAPATLAAILDQQVIQVGALGPLAAAALVAAFRAAMLGDGRILAEPIRRLSAHLPPSRLFILPKDTRQELRKHLAKLHDTLCIPRDWLPLDWAHEPRKLARDEAVPLLAALAEKVGVAGGIGKETTSLLGKVLEQGPPFAELARDGRAATLAIIPVVRAVDKAEIMLTPAAVVTMLGEGLLFQYGILPPIETLAAAVVEPVVHHLRQGINLVLLPGQTLPSTNTVDHRIAVLAKVQRFGPLAARIALFKDLGERLPIPLLRRLLSGKPGLPDNEALVRITGFPEVLRPLVDKLLAHDQSLHVLDPRMAEKLSQEVLDKAQIEDLDLKWLGEQLSGRKNFIGTLEDEQAMALLASDLPDAVLGSLALHKVAGEPGLNTPTALLLGRLDDVPQAMRNLVRIAELWPDPKAAARQNALIAKWSPERQIALALEAERPHRFCHEIAEALGRIAMPDETLAAALRERPWLPHGKAGIAPAAVRDLLPCALVAWDAGRDGPPPVLRSDIPETLLAGLDRHALLDDCATSYRRVLCTIAEHGMNGLVVDLMDNQADLTVLARANCDLEESAWPMFASALRAFDSLDKLRTVLVGVALAAPSTESVIDQLNALANATLRDGRVGEAARRLWRVGFAAHSQALRSATQFFPADILVESESGQFARADKLALLTTGVEDRDSLAARWHFDLPANYRPTSTDNDVPSAPIAERAQELVAPFRQFHELHSAVLLLLAMLGRGPAIRRVAEQFQGNPGFDTVCGDLDAASKRENGLCDPLPNHMAQMRLSVVPLSKGQALVLSAAGTPMLARAESEGALLYGCIKVAGAAHSWQLSMSPIEPRDLNHATVLLRDAVKKLVDPIGMRLHNQSNAVLAQFEGYLQSDQATLDELIADIKDGLAERIKKLARGDYLKRALTRYDTDRKAGRHDDDTRSRQTAKDNLWTEITKPEAAKELLAAVREKMNNRNYAPRRTLFELFQNAVDAAHQQGVPSDVRVEAMRDANGAICHLRLIHWGRPINVPGGARTPARYERDLDNMLDLDSSEKEGEDRGKHGLGFKTCHMLSDSTRVASGRLRFSIRGGMIPVPWEDGRKLQQRYNTREAQATIIDLPITPGREVDAALAWEDFIRVAAFLPVVAPDIGQVIVADGDSEEMLSGKAEVTATANPQIALVSYGRDQRALRLNLGPKHRLYLKLLDGTPVRFATNWHRLWNLAPLDGEDLKVAWLIDGDFAMDQGRRGLHGQSADKLDAIRHRGPMLGQRLVELYEQWDAIAPATGLAANDRDAFFARLIELMAGDLNDPLAQHLHGITCGDRGLAALLRACTVVPLADGGLVCSDDVTGFYNHTLANPEVRAKVKSWRVRQPLLPNAVDDVWAGRLERLGFGVPAELDLGWLARNLFLNPEVEAAQAAAYGAVFNSSARDSWQLDERGRVDAAIKTVNLRSAADGFVLSNQLWFPQDQRQGREGETERLRAAFMPLTARLHHDYQGDAVEFAQLARGRAGYRAQEERQHLLNAYRDPDLCLAALVYLATEPSQIKGLNWLPDVAALRALPAYALLSPLQRSVLEVYLSDQAQPPVPSSEPQPEPDRSPSEILKDVIWWWLENRADLSTRHDRDTYGDLCSPYDLRAGDDVAWFTLLSLGSFQTLGRITPQQSRVFVERGVAQGWWRDLATIGDDRDLEPYRQRLLSWSEIDAPEENLMWRRCLGDMCMIARHLHTYRAIFEALPQMIRQEDAHFSLSGLLHPSSSFLVGRMGIDGGPLARSLGMGANWIVRELARRGVYDAEDAAIVQPFAWSTRLRIRNFARSIGLGEFESGMDHGRTIHDAVVDAIDNEAPFGVDGDLPLELLNTRSRHHGYPAARGEILNGTWSPDEHEVETTYA